MGFSRYLIPAAVLLALAAPAGAGVIIPQIAVSQDGKHFIKLPVLASARSVERYFSPHGTAAPRCGTEANTADFAFYFNRTDDTLCLLVVSGTPRKDSGLTTVEIAGLGGSPSPGVELHTKALDINAAQGTASFTLNSTRGISGLSLGDIGSGPFTMQIQLATSPGDTQFRLAAGTGHRDQHVAFMDLNPDAPLVIESDPPATHHYDLVNLDSPGDSTPVPEPASLSLLGLAGALLARPRRIRGGAV